MAPVTCSHFNSVNTMNRPLSRALSIKRALLALEQMMILLIQCGQHLPLHTSHCQHGENPAASSFLPPTGTKKTRKKRKRFQKDGSSSMSLQTIKPSKHAKNFHVHVCKAHSNLFTLPIVYEHTQTQTLKQDLSGSDSVIWSLFQNLFFTINVMLRNIFSVSVICVFSAFNKSPCRFTPQFQTESLT